MHSLSGIDVVFVHVRIVVLLLALTAGGCAVTPEMEERARKTEEDIASILSEPLDKEEYGRSKKCLSGNEYRDFEVLDDRRIVFEGRGGRLWLNQLRGRCPGLRDGRVLRFRSYLELGRICDLDRFEVLDWVYLPRYQRWPWDWWQGVPCTLGEFQPVSEAQVDAMGEALRSR